MYGQKAIYRPLKELVIREKPSKRSKKVKTIRTGCKIYVDRIRRNWGRICFIMNDYVIGGDLVYNGCWIPLDENVVIVWAENREINKRQQEVSS